MVTHVLVNESTSNVDRLILWHLHEHATEALEGLVEPVQVAIHSSKMESTANEIFTYSYCLLEHLNRLFLEGDIFVFGIQL